MNQPSINNAYHHDESSDQQSQNSRTNNRLVLHYNWTIQWTEQQSKNWKPSTDQPMASIFAGGRFRDRYE
ncbi:hypothetical protein PSHT_01258 [Puccinia striiformis]|uniref:Uncharacterized protein n=1 Tax=Puccinia striiformis TaxID=27350 RepID=A0A2S4WKV3_9BASI|nr:hypothetical protein PSHT_01258 [Puccinia striiformis]